MIGECYVGDTRAGLRAMIAAGVKVQTCVTSPPYWGLRDYGTAQWEGGDAACDHIGKDSRTVSGGAGKQYSNTGSNRVFSGDCDCGARRVDSQLGLEPTIAEYVDGMVEVFGLVRDVLADDGTLWLNLGDSYATGAGAVGQHPGGGKQGEAWQGAMTSPNRMPQHGRRRMAQMSLELA
jgi:site-specific DNA-methyltransferase (cytosine-N4-specific)